jgi:hypothetical protein
LHYGIYLIIYFKLNYNSYNSNSFLYRIRGNRDKRGNTCGNSRGRGDRGGRKNKKKMPNKDKLDAQLDSFIKSKNN